MRRDGLRAVPLPYFFENEFEPRIRLIGPWTGSVHGEEHVEYDDDDAERHGRDDDCAGGDLDGFVRVLGVEIPHESGGLGEASALVLLGHGLRILDSV